MSIIRIDANNSITKFDRRRHVRQRLGELAYLDIGADNGGIILNLSDEGMGFQAAVPLSSQTEVNLLIQLPSTRIRLEIAAEIVWLGPGNQQAGVRFIDMSSEARVQIHEWIRSQLAPNRASQIPAPRIKEGSDSFRKQDPVPATRTNKWLSLMGELEEQQRLLERRLPTESSPDTGHAGAISQEKRPNLIAQRNGLNYSGQQEIPVHGELLKESYKDENHNQLGAGLSPQVTDNHPNEEDGVNSSAAVTSYAQPERREILDWPIRAPKIESTMNPKIAPMRTAPPVESVDPPASVAEANTNVAAMRDRTMPTPLAPRRSSLARGWVAPAILLTSICILFFGIGTWVGRPGSHPQVAQPPAEPAVEVPVTKPALNSGIKEDGTKHPTVIAQKGPTGAATAKPATKNRESKAERTPNSPIAISTPQPTPAQTSSTVLMAAKPPENKPVPASSKESPPELLAAKPPENKLMSAPASQTSDPSLPAQKIVAGRQLRPSDRFNPCHLSYRVEPAYPVEAQQQRIEGAVKIHQVIGADGIVQSVRLLSGPPLLVPAAMEAAKYWRYLPALLNGQPVQTEQDIEIDFRLPH